MPLKFTTSWSSGRELDEADKYAEITIVTSSYNESNGVEQTQLFVFTVVLLASCTSCHNTQAALEAISVLQQLQKMKEI